MPDEVTPYEYQLIDIDPHFSRVVRYMRPSDYGYWAAFTAAFPSAMYALQAAEPLNMSKRAVKGAARLSTVLGFTAGFLFAYQRSSYRFFGKTENERERQLDMEEMTSRIKQGKSLYGESDLSPFLQKQAHHNSLNSQYLFHALPWFNFVNHPYHGVDTQKYYDAAKEQQ